MDLRIPSKRSMDRRASMAGSLGSYPVRGPVGTRYAGRVVRIATRPSHGGWHGPR
jgi:hypothetical protein